MLDVAFAPERGAVYVVLTLCKVRTTDFFTLRENCGSYQNGMTHTQAVRHHAESCRAHQIRVELKSSFSPLFLSRKRGPPEAREQGTTFVGHLAVDDEVQEVVEGLAEGGAGVAEGEEVVAGDGQVF